MSPPHQLRELAALEFAEHGLHGIAAFDRTTDGMAAAAGDTGRPTQTPAATRPQWCGCTVANGPHQEMDRPAIACFDQALAEVGLAGDDRLRQVLYDYFAWATTGMMSRYHRSADNVPDGLASHSVRRMET